MFAVAAFASAANAAPKHCDVEVRLASGAKDITAKGAVKSITHVKDHDAIVFTDDKNVDHAFDLWIDTIPFKAKSIIDVTIRRGAAFQILYDALIKDGAGKTLIISSRSGAIDLADGWRVTTGAVFESRQDPNQKQQSINRTHGLDFERGKTKLSIKPSTCTELEDGPGPHDTYDVTGFGNSWLGVRPPEGVDYQTFSLVRR